MEKEYRNKRFYSLAGAGLPIDSQEPKTTEADNDTQAELAAWDLLKMARKEIAELMEWNKAVTILAEGRLDLLNEQERRHNELKAYLCRIKLPVPVKLFSEICANFPGKDVFCTERDGYLCIYQKS